MVTQINPKGSLAPEVALASIVVAKPQPAPEKTTSNRIADSPPSGGPSGTVVASEKEVATAVKEIREHLAQSGSKLEIQFDKDSGRNVFKVMDASTGGVVLQIPSEEVLAMARKLRETDNVKDTSGVLMDTEG